MNPLARLRWRLAQWIAPTPILAEPLGDGQAWLLLKPETSWNARVWIEASSLELELHNGIQPYGDEFGRSNWMPERRGTFSGTVGEGTPEPKARPMG